MASIDFTDNQTTVCKVISGYIYTLKITKNININT